MKQQKNIKLIVIEKSAAHAERIYRSLRKARYFLPRPISVSNNNDLKNALNEQEWDLIISVSQVGDFNATQVCKTVSSSKTDVPIIVLLDEPKSENNEECQAFNDFCQSTVELLKAGASQVIPKNNDDYLYIVVNRVLLNLEKRRQSLKLEQLFKDSQEQNQMLLESSREAIAYVVLDGLHLYANPSYLKMFEYESLDDLEISPIMDLVSEENQTKFHSFWRGLKDSDENVSQQIKLDGVKSNQELFKMTMEVRHATYDGEDCIRIIVRDQSQNDKWKELDSITGLFNSQHFTKLVDKALVKVRETQVRSVLFYVELDDFDTIKERIGVAGFDPVIKKIAKVIKGLSKEAKIARFSESVFTLLIEDKDGDKYKGAIEFGKTICKAIEDHVIELENTQFFLTASIGIAQVLASVPKPEDVLNDASEACQSAIKNGGNRAEIYKPRIQADAGSSEIAQLIETAEEENRLSLRYQPIVSLHGETIEIYEVLLRMVDSEANVISSYEVFEAAEDSHLSVLLDKWIIKTAINTLQEQEKNGFQTHFFLKLSKQAFKDEEILLFIRECLKSTGVPAERLIFEIKADIASEQVTQAKKFIKLLQTFKCKTALENVKTGKSYEAALKHLPVDYVKIDASYSKDLLENEENQQAMEEIINLAHEFKMKTVSVAIEDADSLATLWSFEADFAQGYIIQEPLDALEFDFAA